MVNKKTKKQEPEQEKIWLKKYWTDKRHESDDSFYIFTLSLEHPTWSYKKLSEETGIKENTIYDWSKKYKYKERKEAKLEYDAKIMDKTQRESKIYNIKKNAIRNMINEELLDAYAKFNQQLIKWLDTDQITIETLTQQRIVNKHLNEYLDLQNKHLKNCLDTEQLIRTIENTTKDADDKELQGLAGALLRSHRIIEENLK